MEHDADAQIYGAPTADALITLQREIFLVVGVMSHPDPAIAAHRRHTIRETWGRHIANAAHGRTILRFVVSEADWSSQGGWSGRAPADQLPLPELRACAGCEGRLYVFRLLGFLRAALRLHRPRWMIKTDDDAYVRVELVRRDLHRIEAARLENVVYGAVEWQSFSATQYAEFAWASGEAHAGRAWRRAIKIKRRTATANPHTLQAVTILSRRPCTP